MPMIYEYEDSTPVWINFENPKGAKGCGGTENSGAKGHAFEHFHAGEEKVLCDLQGSGVVRRIWLTLTIGRQGNARLSACLSGAFRPFRLGGRQPACASKTKNRTKTHRRQVQCSFAGAEMRPDKERPLGILAYAQGP